MRSPHWLDSAAWGGRYLEHAAVAPHIVTLEARWCRLLHAPFGEGAAWRRQHLPPKHVPLRQRLCLWQAACPCRECTACSRMSLTDQLPHIASDPICLPDLQAPLFCAMSPPRSTWACPTGTTSRLVSSRTRSLPTQPTLPRRVLRPASHTSLHMMCTSDWLL